MPTRYYLIRTPAMRGHSLLTGTRRTNKRAAIDDAKWEARAWKDRTPVRNRRVSVYTVEEGQRPSLLFQCHVSRKTGRIVSEIL